MRINMNNTKGNIDSHIKALRTNDVDHFRLALLEEGWNIRFDHDFLLRMAAYEGKLDILKLLVEAGADIHAVNEFGLRWAANRDKFEVVKYLIEKGANLNELGLELLKKVRKGMPKPVPEKLDETITLRLLAGKD